jgi:hypothetical protein
MPEKNIKRKSLPPKCPVQDPMSIQLGDDRDRRRKGQTHSSILSTPPTSFQSAQLTRPTARAASSMSTAGPHEPMTMPLGRSEPPLLRLVEYALRTPVITLCNVSKMSGRPGRMYIPCGSAVRGTRGGRAETRVQCTLKRSDSEVCGDARGCMSGASSGSRE